jgi:hypothetical protein
MHARNRGLASQWGQILDHALDSITVPLTAAAVAYALQVPDWALVLITLTAAMVYHAQLVLQHYTGQFLSPAVYTGTVGQVLCTIAYVIAALAFTVCERGTGWLDTAITVAAAGWVISQLYCCAFYYRRLGTLVSHHVPMVLMGTYFAALYCMGIISVYAYVAVIMCLSFRFSGRCVVDTVLRKRSTTGDTVLLAGIVLLTGLELLPSDYAAYRAAALSMLCTYMVALVVFGILRHRAELD